MNQRHPSLVESHEVNGIRMSVRRTGSGEAFLLLHGFPHTKELWREVEPHLVDGGYQVVAPDLRGLGDSERAQDGFDAQNQALDQVQLLDALGVAEDVVAGSEERYIRYFLEGRSSVGLPEDLAQVIIRAYTGRDSLRAAFEHYRAMATNAEQNLSWAERGRLTMPVAAVTSTVGDLLARQLAAFADDLEAHLLPDSGHVVPIDAPQKAAEILLATAARGA